MTRLLSMLYKLRSILINSGWMMAERLLSLGLTFFVTLFVARYLGPEQFGMLSYAIAIVALFAVVGHAGLGGLVMREIVRNPSQVPEVMGTSFVMKLIGYLVGLLALLAFTLVTEDVGSASFWLLVILATTLLFKPFEVIEFWFATRLQSKLTTYAKVTAMAVSGSAKLLLVLAAAGMVWFAVAHALQVVLTGLLLVWFFRRSTFESLRSWQFNAGRAKALFSEGWMIFLGSIFAVIYLKTDQVMLRWLVGDSEVGIYAVAAVVSETWYFVPAALVTSFFPRLIKMREDNDSRYPSAMQKLYDVLFMLALGLAVLVSLFATPLVNLLFGEAYSTSAPILVVHIWAGVFIFMRAAFSKWLLIEKLVLFSMVTQGLGALFNVVLNWYLIPVYGGEGAAWATLGSYAVASYFSLALSRRTRPAFVMMSKALLAPVRWPFMYWRSGK